MPFLITLGLLIVASIIICHTIELKRAKEYRELQCKALKELGFAGWDVIRYHDDAVIVKSRQALEKYDDIKYFKENKDKILMAEAIIRKKEEVAKKLKYFLVDNEYKDDKQYGKLENQIADVLINADAYRIRVGYISSAGNYLGEKEIAVKQRRLDEFKNDPSLLMSKSEYNSYIKEQHKEALSKKQHEYYKLVSAVIQYANESRDSLVIKGSQERVDDLSAQLFDRTVNSIKKIKTVDSEEWDFIGDYIERTSNDIHTIINQSLKILAYYESEEFARIKTTCEALMSTQREFNEYITEKVQTVSQLFGMRVVRNETATDDEYKYIRPYKKTITPFTAEVSATVFASAENNPLDYVVKNFYPNKAMFPEQIQKLYLFVEELETLKDAKQIIENYKQEYQQYLKDVPAYVLAGDEDGFYTRLGFANIDESVLAVEYKFSYTSGGGMAQRSFTVPMTEETIAELIKKLESKLTASAFAKEQRTLMTRKLRDFIKMRDNFTCCNCGNSTHVEPNLLLEIDHIIPVAKGGCTTEDNLQTLCWKCNRSKGVKIAN